MQFGFFDDHRREYVITSPRTPLPWINYLGSENFFSLISNTCGGYSFYKDAKLLRLTRYRYNDTPLDQNGRYYYIKDGDTVWNPGWQPTQTPLDSYECHHGLGYSRFVSSKNGIAAELTAFVPLADSCEVNRLMLTNNGTEEKTLALTSFVEFCFWNAVDDMTNFQRNFSIGEVEIQGSEIYHKTEYRAADITLFMQSTARSTDTIPTATLSLALTAEMTARRPFCAALQATPLPADGV